MVKYRMLKIMRHIAYLGLIIAVVASSAHAMPPPETYVNGQCELIAKEYQREYGGSLVYIMPVYDNGAYGNYGHFLNKAYSKNTGIYYIDWFSQKQFKNETEIAQWYSDITTQKAEVFDLSKGHPPFNIYWQY